MPEKTDNTYKILMTIQKSANIHETRQCNAIQFKPIHDKSLQDKTIQYKSKHYKTIQYNTTQNQYNTRQT